MKQPFLDTSILIGGLIDFGKSSEGPIELLDRVAEGRIRKAFTAWHCCLEFYSLATRLPEEYRLTPETASELIEKEIFGRMRVATLDAKQRRACLGEAAAQRVTGGRIYDFHIGRTAHQHGASVIVTENKKHFLLFEDHGIPVRTAAEFLAESV